MRVRYLDLDGKPHEIEADGLLATCLQHEIDHLNGMLFIDHISKLKRDRVIKKFTKAAKAAEAVELQERWRPDCRFAWSSWARRISRCRRCSRSSAAAMRSSRSTPGRRSPPGRGMELQPTPVEREARALRPAGPHAEDAEGRDEAPAAFARASAPTPRSWSPTG